MIRKTIVVAACLLAANAAHAQFGSLGGMLGGNKSASAGDINGDVSAFLKKSLTLSLLTTQSLVAINNAFVSDAEAAKARAALAEVNKITDPKEQQARAAELYKSQSAEMQRLKESGKMEAEIGQLDAARKKQIGAALLNFGIGALQAVDLTATGQSLVQKTAASPIDIPKVLPVKDALPLLAKVGADSGGVVMGVLKIAKGADISVPAVKADSKPVELDGFGAQ